MQDLSLLKNHSYNVFVLPLVMMIIYTEQISNPLTLQIDIVAEVHHVKEKQV